MDNCNEIRQEKIIKNLQTEACELIEKGIQFMSDTKMYPLLMNDTLDKEYCIHSTLHRGYYNPSPVYDIIVGNTKRGRISKNPLAEKITHCYYLNQAHKIVRVEFIRQNQVSHTEFLQRVGDTIYGITIDCGGRLSAVCREMYGNGRIVSFALVHCVPDSNGYKCSEYLKENYQYDDEGLHTCNFINYVPNSTYVINKSYKFERKNGILVSYSECSVDKSASSVQYCVRKKRKA